MDDTIRQIERLEERITKLEHENAYLKKLLTKVNINYMSTTEENFTLRQEVCSDQGSRIMIAEITKDIARQFYSYFLGRIEEEG